MFEGLKIAVRQQKKLLVIFFITIFLPSVSLSIFGIIALRNEKFRLAKQIENEQLQIASDIKSKIETKLAETEERLDNLVSYPSFRQKDFAEIKELLTTLSGKDSLIETVFLLYKNEEPFFPLFQSGSDKNENIPLSAYNNLTQKQIKNAEDAEFIRKDYPGAVSIYNNLFLQSGNKTIKARLLNHVARNLMKAGKFGEAADIYTKIITDYPDEKTESGLPLDLHAKLQKTECQSIPGNKESAVINDLAVFEDLLANRWNLNESQFKTYTSIVIERLTSLLSDNSEIVARYKSRFELLTGKFQYKTQQWQTISNIKSYIIPELLGSLQTNLPSVSSYEFSKRIGNEDYLISALTIPGQNQQDNAGMLGIKMNSLFLQDSILNDAIKGVRSIQNTLLYISTLSGDSIKGTRNKEPGAITTTALFDNNFPPWRLELANIGLKGSAEKNIFASFYFWTIITLIIILVFGTALIARIVAREMEILKIKSDFVSSVSHEFKTPLTAMKSLTERIEKGKVTQPAKMKQYISIISKDIDRLIRLVGNILNFSNIEEGKKVYKKEETDITIWLKETINNYKQESVERGISISVDIENDLPPVFIDKDALNQAIFNLLDNAVKFSREDKQVGVAGLKNDSSIVIKIKDKGIGIENDEKDRVFEKFYRGSSAVKYYIKGTGLGLALVKSIVEAHNGSIEVESEPGWSTVFRITLPVC